MLLKLSLLFYTSVCAIIPAVPACFQQTKLLSMTTSQMIHLLAHLPSYILISHLSLNLNASCSSFILNHKQLREIRTYPSIYEIRVPTSHSSEGCNTHTLQQDTETGHKSCSITWIKGTQMNNRRW